MRTRRRLAGLLALVLLVGSGCSPERSSPRNTMDLLVAGLEAGSLAQVPLTAESAPVGAALGDVLADLAVARPSVRASDVETVDASRARTSATLEYEWIFAPGVEAWRYATTVELSQHEGIWRVEWTPEALAPGLAVGERLSSRRVAAERADVVDADGEPIVTQREVQRVGVDKSRLRPGAVKDSAQRLAKLLDIDRAGYLRAVDAAGAQAFVEGLAVRSSDADEIRRLRAGVADIDGARMIAEGRPLAPTRAFAREVLGVAGPATREIIEASGGAVVEGQYAGLSGLQERYDEQLRGRPGLAVTAVDPMDEERVLHTFDAVAGQPLALALDVKTQGAADAAVARLKPASALVAVQPSTGRVLAAANGPGADGFSAATQGGYAPGSTFKIVTALALLRAGMRPSDQVSCTRTVRVDGREFENYDDYPANRLGRVSLTTAFANSCNTALIAENGRVSQADLASAAQALGLNTDPDLGYSFILGGAPDSAGATEHAASMIGQGKVSTNALGLATVVASVVKGERVTPQLLANGPADPRGPAAPLTRAEAEQLRELMSAVTTQGSGRFLADRGSVLSKTGTAEYGEATPPATHAWMVAAQGDLAVAVFVADGSSGSGTAGPVLERFLDRLG